jgi:hypothetical protein
VHERGWHAPLTHWQLESTSHVGCVRWAGQPTASTQAPLTGSFVHPFAHGLAPLHLSTAQIGGTEARLMAQ